MSEPPDTPAPKPSRARLVLIPIALILAALIGAALYDFNDRLSSLTMRMAALETEQRNLRDLDVRVDRLEAQAAPSIDLQSVEARISALEARGDGSALAARAAAEGQRLNAQLTGLEARVVALETKGPSSALELRIVALESRAEGLSSFERIERERAEALALLSLVQAIERGTPFQVELSAFRRVLGDDAALSGLSSAAVSGISRPDELIAQFDETAQAILSAQASGKAPESAWQRLLDHARGLIVIRQTIPLPGDEPYAVVSRTRSALAKGRIDAAVGELHALRDGPAEAASGWLARAQERLSAESEISALSAHLIAEQSGAKK